MRGSAWLGSTMRSDPAGPARRTGRGDVTVALKPAAGATAMAMGAAAARAVIALLEGVRSVGATPAGAVVVASFAPAGRGRAVSSTQSAGAAVRIHPATIGRVMRPVPSWDAPPR